MEIVYVNCPRCQKDFPCDANLVGLPIPLHCPHCDLYFELKEGQGQPPQKGTAFTGLSRIDRETFYLPAQGETKKGKRQGKNKSGKR